MLDRKFIEGKISLIEEYFYEMEDVVKFGEKEILKDNMKLRALERDFQLIVDEMIDINLHFIRELDLKSPDDFQNTFSILAASNIIPDDFAEKFAPVVGTRNILAHRYEKVDKKLFISQVKNERKDFLEYLKLINQYLKKT
ncbi:MAG: HepT-like ribonuclease domain-containing protein [Patescibacteria group bacterium]